MDKALQMISQHAEDGAKLRRDFFAVHGGKVVEAARRMAVAVARGGKILLAGNGGSAADAQHWAAEFVNRFLMDRPPLPAIALTTDSSVLTSIGNDFLRSRLHQAGAGARASRRRVRRHFTSGNSANVIGALQAARKQSLFTIGLTGDGGGRMAPLCDILLAVGHPSTPLVQETHAAIGHMLCALTDYYLFENVMAIKPMLD
ncbi:MAG: SIS domain-containing protein [Bilophila wadsworthia]